MTQVMHLKYPRWVRKLKCHCLTSSAILFMFVLSRHLPAQNLTLETLEQVVKYVES